MGKERNVESLANHLVAALGSNPRRPRESESEWAHRVAEWMIDTTPSCLVPTEITDEEATLAVQAAIQFPEGEPGLWDVYGDELGQALVRLARGEETT